MKKTLIISLLLCLLLLLLGGCGLTEKLHLFKSQPAAEEGRAAESTVEQQLNITQGDGIADDDAQAVGSATDPAAADSAITTALETGDSTEVLLYFVSADGSSLEAETRSIPKQEGVARATVNQLLAGPQQDDLSAALPASVALRDINIRDGLCTVDFSGELLQDAATDTQSQLLALYSIVNTLSQFDSVDYVQILVEGQNISSSYGGVDISAALAPVSEL